MPATCWLGALRPLAEYETRSEGAGDGCPQEDQAGEALNDLEPMLTRFKLSAIRDQLDTLLDQAGRAELNLREGLSDPDAVRS